MNYPSLPPEDLPPHDMTLNDHLIHRQLEDCLNHYFYTACVRQVQQSDRRQEKRRSLLAILSQCIWFVTMNAKTAMLAIECPDLATCWRVLENIEAIAQLLEELAIRKIRIAPPSHQGTPLEIRIDEISVYQDLPSKTRE
jgi:hypothetical protein